MFNLDLTNTPDSSGFTIPPGTYTVIMDDCSIKETKSGTGEYINAKFKILTGPCEGKSLFQMFNIKNDNPKAVEIGLQQLKSFMKCAQAKSFQLTNVLDLVGLRCDAVVKTRSDDYGDKSVISWFKPTGTAVDQAPAPKSANPFG